MPGFYMVNVSTTTYLEPLVTRRGIHMSELLKSRSAPKQRLSNRVRLNDSLLETEEASTRVKTRIQLIRLPTRHAIS